MTKFFLYKLEPALERLKKRDLGNKGEKYIENLFSQNTQSIFPELFFLDNQVNIEDKRGKKYRADTLLYDKVNNTFVVIEYKNEQSRNLFHQAKFYLSWLSNKKWGIVYENRKKIEGILKKRFKERQEEEKGPQWDKSYALCITTNVGKYEDYFEETEEKIRLVEIDFYDNTLLINSENLPHWLQFISTAEKPGRSNETLPSPQFSISELVEAVEPINPSLTQEWLEQIDKLVSKEFNWKNPKIFFDLPYKEGGRGYVRNYIKYSLPNSKKTAFSFIVWEGKKVVFSPYGNFLEPEKLSPNLRNLLEKYSKYKTKKHWAEGNWHFLSVKTVEDFQELKKFFREYKEKLPENSEVFK